MRITFDETKNIANIEKHGFSLDMFCMLDLSVSVQTEDTRFDYGERRLRIFAPLNGRLCTAVAVIRNEGGEVRVISLRKSNARERKWYDQQIKS